MSLTRPSGFCACGEVTAVRQVMVRHVRSGQRRICPCSEVAVIDNAFHRSDWDNIRLQEPWEFVRWVEKCASCFLEEDPQQELAA